MVPTTLTLLDRAAVDIVVDNIGKMVVQNGLARIELLSAKSLGGEGEAAEYELTARLAMSLDSLLKFHQGMTAVIGQLEAKGVVQKRSTEPSTKSTKKPN